MLEISIDKCSMHVHKIVNKTVSNSMVMKDMMTLCQTSIGAHHDCFRIQCCAWQILPNILQMDEKN